MTHNDRPIDKDIPVWRETPLDHWSRDIDPVIMAGDEWVEVQDPGMERFEASQFDAATGERFMHPTIDTNYGLENDRFTDETGQHTE